MLCGRQEKGENSITLGGCHDNFLPDVRRFAVGQNQSGERDFCSEVRGGEWLGTGDDKIEVVGGTRFKTGAVPADDPSGGLANHLALGVQQEADSTGGFNFFGQSVFYRQFHDSLLADNLCWRNRNHKLCHCE